MPHKAGNVMLARRPKNVLGRPSVQRSTRDVISLPFPASFLLHDNRHFEAGIQGRREEGDPRVESSIAKQEEGRK